VNADQPPATHPETPPSPVAAALAEPYSSGELRLLLQNPGRTFDVVLAGRERLAATIGAGRTPWLLVSVLLLCTTLASLPYGIVRGAECWWKIAALLGGSTLLCFPSLQVFGAYLGCRLRPIQNLALALVISSVAALFTLGFCPIVWFLGQTMAVGDWIDADVASLVMLAAALAAGLAQLTRCASTDPSLRANGSLPLLAVWQLLVAFVALRMARALGLFG
jgi:hypothetical protein